MTSLCQGRFSETQHHLDMALKEYGPISGGVQARRGGADYGVSALSFQALLTRVQGDPQRALRRSEQAIQRAAELGHPQTLANAFFFASLLGLLEHDPAASRSFGERLIAVARKHSLALYAISADVYVTWAECRLAPSADRTQEFRQSIAIYLAAGNRLWVPLFLGRLAEVETDTRDKAALQTIDKALLEAAERGERWTDAFLSCLRGDILLKRDLANHAPAEEAYRSAMAVAKEQGARSFELIAALSLAKLFQSTSRPAEAHAVVASALEGFLPTPEMPEIGEAQALLESLARGGERAIASKDQAT
jgi:predicted ATPase